MYWFGYKGNFEKSKIIGIKIGSEGMNDELWLMNDEWWMMKRSIWKWGNLEMGKFGNERMK